MVCVREREHGSIFCISDVEEGGRAGGALVKDEGWMAKEEEKGSIAQTKSSQPL